MGHEIQKFRLVGGMAGAVARYLISGDTVSPPDRFPKGQPPEHSGDEACVEGIPGPRGVSHVHLERFRGEFPLRLTVKAPSPPIREITVRPSTAKALTESFQSSLGQKE